MRLTEAQSFLQREQRRNPLPTISRAKADEILAELGGVQNLTVELEDRVSRLVDEIVPSLPSEVQALLRDGKLAVGEIGLESPNAHVTRLQVDQFVIVLHSGLFAFLYRIARPLVSTVFRSTPEDESGIEPSTLARVVAEIFWWLQKIGTSFGPDYSITLEQRLLANILAMRAERFLLAHEIGHVFVAMESARASQIQPLDDSMEEHFADVFALNLTLNSIPIEGDSGDEFSHALTYAGAELALQIWGTMEKIGIGFLDGAHPSSTERVRLLRLALRERCDSEITFEAIIQPARIIEQTFEVVAKTIDKPGEWAVIFSSEADRLMQDFELLLESCSRENVPDYATFYEEAPFLLARGYPEVILRDVFGRVVEELKGARSNDALASNEARRRFSRFKLLFGLSEQLPEPVKAIYAAAFRDL